MSGQLPYMEMFGWEKNMSPQGQRLVSVTMTKESVHFFFLHIFLLILTLQRVL